jgi:hypothetical protein
MPFSNEFFQLHNLRATSRTKLLQQKKNYNKTITKFHLDMKCIKRIASKHMTTCNLDLIILQTNFSPCS